VCRQRGASGAPRSSVAAQRTVAASAPPASACADSDGSISGRRMKPPLTALRPAMKRPDTSPVMNRRPRGSPLSPRDSARGGTLLAVPDGPRYPSPNLPSSLTGHERVRRLRTLVPPRSRPRCRRAGLASLGSSCSRPSPAWSVAHRPPCGCPSHPRGPGALRAGSEDQAWRSCASRCWSEAPRSSTKHAQVMPHVSAGGSARGRGR